MTPWNKGKRKMNDRLRAAFLDHLKMTASPTRACAAAGLSTTTAYREREENIGFRADWDKAVDLALEQLLGQAYRLSMEGLTRPVVSGGRVVTGADGEPLTETAFSERLLEVMLRWRIPQMNETRLRISRDDPIGLEQEVILLMEPDDRRQLIALLHRYAELAAGRPAAAALELGHG